jgi:hypothetical protein
MPEHPVLAVGHIGAETREMMQRVTGEPAILLGTFIAGIRQRKKRSFIPGMTTDRVPGL